MQPISHSRVLLPGEVSELTSEDLAVWRETVSRRIAERPEPFSNEELAELADFNRQVYGDQGEPSAIVEAIRRLGDEATLAVVTGQQPGLLAGPLYSFYKAASAVIRARQLERALGRPVQSVFWIAGDDHDFEEAATCAWLSDEGRCETFRLPDLASDKEGHPVSSLSIGKESLEYLLRRIKETTRVQALGMEIEPLLRSASSEGTASLEMLFGRLLARLLAGTGLIFVAPRLSFLRRRQRPVIEKEIRRPLETSRLVIAAGEEIEARGGSSQLHRAPDAVNLFLFEKGVRCRLRFESATRTFESVLPGEGKEPVSRYDEAELLSLLENEPERFSPNVVTRPVVQDGVFPTVGYIAGPGEQAYFRQLSGVYEFFGVPMPRIVPRPSLLLAEARVLRSLEKLGATLEEFSEAVAGGESALESLKQRLLATPESEALNLRAQKTLEEIQRLVTELEAGVPGQATTTRQAAAKLKSALEKPSAKLEQALVRDLETLAQTRLDHWNKVVEALHPLGKPQERVYNPLVPYCQLYGADLPMRLLKYMAEHAGAERLLVPLLDLEELPAGSAGAAPEMP